MEAQCFVTCDCCFGDNRERCFSYAGNPRLQHGFATWFYRTSAEADYCAKLANCVKTKPIMTSMPSGNATLHCLGTRYPGDFRFLPHGRVEGGRIRRLHARWAAVYVPRVTAKLAWALALSVQWVLSAVVSQCLGEVLWKFQNTDALTAFLKRARWFCLSGSSTQYSFIAHRDNRQSTIWRLIPGPTRDLVGNLRDIVANVHGRWSVLQWQKARKVAPILLYQPAAPPNIGEKKAVQLPTDEHLEESPVIVSPVVKTPA
eukprot:IDg9993t1